MSKTFGLLLLWCDWSFETIIFYGTFFLVFFALYLLGVLFLFWDFFCFAENVVCSRRVQGQRSIFIFISLVYETQDGGTGVLLVLHTCVDGSALCLQ